MNITPNEIEVQIGDSAFLGHFAAEYDRDMMFFKTSNKFLHQCAVISIFLLLALFCKPQFNEILCQSGNDMKILGFWLLNKCL